MNPLRWEVLALAMVLATPVLVMGMQGDLTVDEVIARLPWCLGAAWAALAILHAFTRPEQAPTRHPRQVRPLATEQDQNPASTP